MAGPVSVGTRATKVLVKLREMGKTDLALDESRRYFLRRFAEGAVRYLEDPRQAELFDVFSDILSPVAYRRLIP